jgi:hypothetical protein
MKTKHFRGTDTRPRRREELRRLKRELEVTRQERDMVQKAFIVLSRTEGGDSSLFKSTSREYAVKTMCRVRCSVIRGYYAWCKREPSLRQLENERRTEHIRRASKMGRQVYGSPRMHAEMRAQGISCGKHRVVRCPETTLHVDRR